MLVNDIAKENVDKTIRAVMPLILIVTLSLDPTPTIVQHKSPHHYYSPLIRDYS